MKPTLTNTLNRILREKKKVDSFFLKNLKTYLKLEFKSNLKISN